MTTPMSVKTTTATTSATDRNDRKDVKVVKPTPAELMEDTVMVSGEGRFRWLHAAPERVDALAERTRQRYGDEAWVWTTEELIDGQFFGGPLRSVARSRLA